MLVLYKKITVNLFDFLKVTRKLPVVVVVGIFVVIVVVVSVVVVVVAVVVVGRG